ncbi:kinase-like domain-containing protein [Mycena filopes]|nr:kinase-like domain-containing protein [Mycena filopes]
MNRQRSSSILPESLDARPELENYDVMEEIGSGESSTVFLVNCKRGRLRSRQLALRKSPLANRTEPPSDSSSIYLSLSHPCIASLFSTFSTPSARYHLLELCLGGTISSYLETEQPLSETRLRGVLKSLFEALTYLKQQGVVHRSIKPSSILLTADGRVKLGGFELASYLPPSKLPLDRFTKDPAFVAPQILSDLPYNCDADLWSVGCVAITCQSGRPPFESNSGTTVEKILNASYTLSPAMSTEMQDLVVKLLDINPARRIQPADISAHPFFKSNLLVHPLSPFVPQVSESALSKHALFESTSKGSASYLSAGHYGNRKNSCAPNKTATEDVRSARQRTMLSRQFSARRIVSDPLPRRQVSSSSPPLISQPEASKQPPRSQGRASLDVPDSYLTASPPVCSLVPAVVPDLHRSILQSIPVGTTRPVPFTTALLSPEMHKTVHGQISVLPSLSLLVDLREGERRRGQKGAEVLVINSQGTEAPHLSSPCCLAEPTKKYTIDDLPSHHWRQYNDAALLVERIKQRTPKLILHTTLAKCTLMANTPRGDIELFFGSQDDGPRMRMRLSRGCGSLEIARHLSGARGEEWTRTVLKTTDGYPHLSLTDWDALAAIERDGMAHLARFWRTCEALENLEREELPALHSGKPNRPKKKALSPLQIRTQTASPPASFSSTQTLPLVNVAPRPPKLPFTKPYLISSKLSKPEAPMTPDAPSRKALHTQRAPSISDDGFSVTGNPTTAAILPTWCKEDFGNELDGLTAERRRAQTKYIPSVGWCIRHGSCVSEGGRYRIMFFDGAVLEIDVDEDWAEFTSAGGQPTRHNIRECGAKRHIAERMKAFGAFLTMFEED